MGDRGGEEVVWREGVWRQLWGEGGEVVEWRGVGVGVGCGSREEEVRCNSIILEPGGLPNIQYAQCLVTAYGMMTT